MSKVESSERFTVGQPLERVWPFFKDLVNIGRCIPGCEEVVSTGQDTAKFRVKIKLGYISKTVNMNVTMSVTKPDEELTFKGVSEDARITGKLTFENSQNNATATTVGYALSIEAASALARTGMAFMGKDFVKSQTQLFADCVRSKVA
jgi:carbon monoxide dehydrogenase subunit G